MIITLGQSYSFYQLGQRQNQEDAKFPDVDITDDKQRFFVVCDGVGGSEKGEVASDTVCKSFGATLSHFDFSKDFSNADFSMALDKAYDALDQVSKHEDMATTLTFICFHGKGCTMAHIGDSRIYHIRPECGILYRSEDHSLVNSMIHNGVISPEEGQSHPQQHVITRCMETVGKDESRSQATVFRTGDIKKGDYFFLCTDGVLSSISDDELTNIISDEKLDLQEKMNLISEKCSESSDNNTAWLIPVVDVVTDEEPISKEIEDSSTGTRRMRVPREGSEEIESNQKTKESHLKEWIKKILNH